MENRDRMLGEGIARQELNLLFVIDNSGSMEPSSTGHGRCGYDFAY